jgi:hypothetical protein
MHLNRYEKTKCKKILILVLLVIFMTPISYARPPDNAKSKFYDFNEQVIDGEIRKPTALYTDARQRAKFNRLLRLKKSFLPMLFRTSKNKIFK